MQRTIRIAFALIFLSLVTLAILPGRSIAQRNDRRIQDCEDPDARLLSALDECIQQRFKDIDFTFGYRRIIRAGDTPHRFKPENAKEVQAVGELAKSNLKVVFYLAGRSVLGAKPSEPELTAGKLIKGPALITLASEMYANLPKASELWDESRKAMLAFEKTNQYDFTVGKWKFAARAVRASEQSCLDCHVSGAASLFPVNSQDAQKRTLRLGDPLGVALYAYER
ncbi:MAG TPA: hypothetical protein VNN73_01980 [Blastocatellia bacterium]|nr:hypothetical protein [Blastocatellia bacterium]